MKLLTRFFSFAALYMLAGLNSVRAHEHLAAGATMPTADSALLFVNAAVFAAESRTISGLATFVSR